MRKYLLIAATTKAARAFADLNGWKPSKYKIAKTVRGLDGIHDLVAVFVDGWRARGDALAMVQKVNEAEVNGVKIIEAKNDQVLSTTDSITDSRI